MSQRAVAVIGDPNDINCWSNIPYFFLQAGQKAGFFQTGLPLQPERQKWTRLGWNLASLFRGERYGGFQYTRKANESWFKQLDLTDISEIICHFQLFPPYELANKFNISFSHYIDFPLPCLFQEYGIANTIGKKTADYALKREQEQYQAARYVVCMSPWSARQVIERCGIHSEKVKVIIPGANLPESAFDSKEETTLTDPPDGKKTPLRIAFVGKIPLRKGLDRLVAGVRILRAKGYKIQVRVIGPKENLFPHDPEVEHLGFINKLHEPLRLVQELQSCHIGALPSYQEAFGIAALEYLRCGLPALITKVGGLGDSIPDNCGLIMTGDCTGEDIANSLENLLKNPDFFQSLRENARKNASYASWDRTIREFEQLYQD
jgi:glycosyltransferase involved in cell wall biosynthesis